MAHIGTSSYAQPGVYAPGRNPSVPTHGDSIRFGKFEGPRSIHENGHHLPSEQLHPQDWRGSPSDVKAKQPWNQLQYERPVVYQPPLHPSNQSGSFRNAQYVNPVLPPSPPFEETYPHPPEARNDPTWRNAPTPYSRSNPAYMDRQDTLYARTRYDTADSSNGNAMRTHIETPPAGETQPKGLEPRYKVGPPSQIDFCYPQAQNNRVAIQWLVEPRPNPAEPAANAVPSFDRRQQNPLSNVQQQEPSQQIPQKRPAMRTESVSSTAQQSFQPCACSDCSNPTPRSYSTMSNGPVPTRNPAAQPPASSSQAPPSGPQPNVQRREMPNTMVPRADARGSFEYSKIDGQMTEIAAIINRATSSLNQLTKNYESMVQMRQQHSGPTGPVVAQAGFPNREENSQAVGPAGEKQEPTQNSGASELIQEILHKRMVRLYPYKPRRAKRPAHLSGVAVQAVREPFAMPVD
ncbi:hypothetical protein HK102_000909 [Quaeritorhiza haematococci]|nr:hypothetical protein HK102_000909 [Quaeritorhiza haematococci]